MSPLTPGKFLSLMKNVTSAFFTSTFSIQVSDFVVSLLFTSPSFPDTLPVCL